MNTIAKRHQQTHALRDAAQSLLFPIAKRFIAGETLREALDVVGLLNRSGFLTTLDHLGESVSSVEEATHATRQNIIILRALKERGLDLNISVKPTQLGLAIDRDLYEENLRKIVETADELGVFVRVDIEGSQTTSDTFEVILKLKKKHVPVGAAVQAMLKRTPDDVMRLMESDVTIRLCKGAYKESFKTAYTNMSAIRDHYLSIAKRLLTSNQYHGIATHDEEVIEKIKAFVTTQKIARDHFEFQMLYGVRRDLQQRLRDQGWRVRIYVPFGHAWLPYTLRRLRERKENAWFILKNLFRQ